MLQKQNRLARVAYYFIALGCAVNIGLFSFTWMYVEHREKDTLLTLGKSLVGNLPSQELGALKGDGSDLERPEYTRIKNSLFKIRQIDLNMRFAYVFRRTGGKIVFLADSEPPDSADYSPPGQDYTEMTAQELRVFDKNIAIVTGPSSDRWGTWISVLVPLGNQDTGQVEEVFGMDYSVQVWRKRIFLLLADAFVFLITILTMLAIMFLIQRQNRKIALLDKKAASGQKLINAIFYQAPVGICVMNGQKHSPIMNQKYVDILGRSKEALLGLEWTQITHPDDLEADQENYRRFNKNEMDSYTMEKRYLRGDGSTVWTDMAIRALNLGEEERSSHVCILNDISARMADEAKLEESENKYRSIVDNAQEGIFQTSREGRYLMANQALAEMLGYDSPTDLISSVTDIARQVWYDEKERLELLKQVDERGAAARFECRYRRKDGSMIWVSLDQHAIRDNAGTILRYEGFCEDITEKRLSLERMRKALEGTIDAIAAAVEARDPYTAGHQSRVADLAQAIAIELGLPVDTIEGLRLAATIHDLGKLTIPAEILTKPKTLLGIEYSLIQTHSQTGYDILKSIEFPWPIARIVLEHHERMDGSGYPNGLKGDQVLLESRILAVADVVESMASFRPYRPALGIDAALEEIEKNKGILYDAEVVDGCKRLFREKGYVFPLN
jgi:PAS domain S-box-containing protein